MIIIYKLKIKGEKIMIKKNVTLALSLLLIGLVTVSTQALSQNYNCYDNWTSSADMNWWNNDIPSEYALSTNQVEKINEIRATSNEKILPLQNELLSLRTEYRNYNSTTDVDVQKIKSVRKNIRDLEDKISDINLDTKVQIKKILTKEQLKYFDDGGYGWWNMDDNCWHSNHSKMLNGEQGMMTHESRCCGW